MKINLIQQNSNQSFKGTVYLNKANMTVFDLELIQKESKKIVELASKKIPDFTIEKKNHNTMQIKANLKNRELTADVFGYNVEKRNNNIQAILDTINNISETFK
jgi:DNA-directed RNA polymerase specialized sigma54-like protein